MEKNNFYLKILVNLRKFLEFIKWVYYKKNLPNTQSHRR
jgi:hypothetical protein